MIRLSLTYHLKCHISLPSYPTHLSKVLQVPTDSRNDVTPCAVMSLPAPRCHSLRHDVTPSSILKTNQISLFETCSPYKLFFQEHIYTSYKFL